MSDLISSSLMCMLLNHKINTISVERVVLYIGSKKVAAVVFILMVLRGQCYLLMGKVHCIKLIVILEFVGVKPYMASSVGIMMYRSVFP